MNSRLGFVSGTGIVLGAVALALIVATTLILGPALFSPGSLNSSSTGQPLGGVTNHAQIGNKCEACHSAPWSSRTMGDKCIGCHADVGQQIQTQSGLHAQMAGTAASPTCKGCHTEHHGPNGQLTYFDHSKFPFKLTGAHRNLACTQCHTNARTLQDFQNAPQTCFGCHQSTDPHKGQFGQQCDQCHNTTTWLNAKFDHSVFPINHGTDQQASNCQTCHPNGVTTYTCLGCHEHTPQTVANDHEGQNASQLQDCIRCHPQGRAAD